LQVVDEVCDGGDEHEEDEDDEEDDDVALHGRGGGDRGLLVGGGLGGWKKGFSTRPRDPAVYQRDGLKELLVQHRARSRGQRPRQVQARLSSKQPSDEINDPTWSPEEEDGRVSAAAKRMNVQCVVSLE